MDHMKKRLVPELLAPAGSRDSMIAAVSNGADAVYMGGGNFNARAGASNFVENEMLEAIDYCHVRGVKTYITLNTIIKEAEIESVLKFVSQLNNWGADGVIVQDLATAKLVKNLFPSLPLHASTQMTIQNLGGIKLLKKLGFSRAILPRELSMANITELANEDTGVELEVFVHGALCVSYSGQCLMSSMIGGRSGNRGKCAQPCRLEYSMVNENGVDIERFVPGNYLLSPRDLMSLNILDRLVACNVASLKIEGRMKRPEYVATVTSVYRKALDKIAENRDRYIADPDDVHRLEAIFNRGFSSGYFVKNQGLDMMSPTKQSNRGVLLGRIIEYDNLSGTASITLEKSLHVGDGIEVWVKTGGRVGTTVTRISTPYKGPYLQSAHPGQTVIIDIKGMIRTGDRVFKNFDCVVEDEAHKSFTSGEIRRVPLKFKVRCKLGEKLWIYACDIDGNEAEAISDSQAFAAEKTPLSLEYLTKYISRLGNTPFEVENIDADLDGISMVPVSVINNLRRDIVSQIESARILKKRRKETSYDLMTLEDIEKKICTLSSNSIKPGVNNVAKPNVCVKASDCTAAEECLKAGADIVCVGPETFVGNRTVTIDELEKLIEFAHDLDKMVFVSTPRIAISSQFSTIQSFMRKAYDGGADGIVISNIGLLEFARSLGEWVVVTDWTLNILNPVSACSMIEIGADDIMCSCEINREELLGICKKINSYRLGVLVQGPVELMISEQCTLGSIIGGRRSEQKCSAPCRRGTYYLKDRMDACFRVITDNDCRMHILNSVDLSLAEHVDDFVDMGLGYIWLDMRTKERQKAIDATSIYRKLIDELVKSRISSAMSSEQIIKLKATARKQIEDMFGGKITKGHFFRGV